MIELRCLTKLHGKVDPEITYEVKCRDCSVKFKRTIFHLWTIEQILDAQQRGITVVYPLLGHSPPEQPGKGEADRRGDQGARWRKVVQD